MTTKDELLLHTWPKQQAKGKMTYMAIHALIYSVLVGIISLLFSLGDAPVKDIILSKDYLAKLVLFTIIGVIMANYKWKANNRKFEELNRQSEEQPEPQL